MQGGPTPTPVTQNQGAAVGLTSSVVELEFLVDRITSAIAEIRRGQALSRHVTRNCRGATLKQSRV